MNSPLFRASVAGGPIRLFAAMAAVLVFTLFPAHAATGAPPFCPGERLAYRLSWEFAPAGEIVMRVLPFKLVGGEPAWHFNVRVRTNFLAGLFRKMDSEADSYVSLDLGESLAYELRTRGGRIGDNYLLTFDWRNLTAGMTGPGRSESRIRILPGTLDPWGVFYSFRGRPKQGREGDVLREPVSDGKRLVIAELAFGAVRTVRTPAGEFEARLLTPDLKGVSTVFGEGADSGLEIRVSDDGRRIPVRFSGKAAIGRYYAELTEYDLPGGCRDLIEKAKQAPQGLPEAEFSITGGATQGPGPGPDWRTTRP